MKLNAYPQKTGFFGIKFWIVTLLIISCYLCTSTLTHAVSQPAVKGLTISPLRSELTIAPGTVYTGQLSITNTTNAVMNVTMSAEAFGVINEEYDYSFDPGSRLVDWVRFDPSLATLQSGSSQTVTYSISVPIGAEPRGQYISLFAQSNNQSSGAGIISQERVASLLYITVAGNVSRSGSIVSLHNPWLMLGSSTWTAEIRNTGTTHFRSVYSLSVQTLFNTTLTTTNSSDLILPASIRLVTGSIAVPPISGIYKLSYDIGLGDNPAAKVTHYVLYIRPIDVVVITTLVLLWISWRLIHNRNKHKPTN